MEVYLKKSISDKTKFGRVEVTSPFLNLKGTTDVVDFEQEASRSVNRSHLVDASSSRAILKFEPETCQYDRSLVAPVIPSFRRIIISTIRTFFPKLLKSRTVQYVLFFKSSPHMRCVFHFEHHIKGERKFQVRITTRTGAWLENCDGSSWS